MRAAALALTAALAGCTSILPDEEPLPGKEGTLILLPGTAAASAGWPDVLRRGAIFVVENRTGVAVEALVLEFTGKSLPRELLDATILEPPGHRATILPAPHGTWPLRARLGDPGSILLRPGESLRMQLTVDGKAAFSRVTLSIPGVTEP